jgi:uncharacterized protein
MRYLVRLANNKGYLPKDLKILQEKIRELLGSENKIGNLRISSSAIEFDLFAEPPDLKRPKVLLESVISPLLTLRSIDSRATSSRDHESLREGIDLFNQERFWEAHEVLEEIWHPATGDDRDLIQGIILTAAAFVHYQKNENTVCLSILGRAMEKLGTLDNFKGLDTKRLRAVIEQIMKDHAPRLIRIEWAKAKTAPDSP